jgi:hypothetical protein
MAACETEPDIASFPSGYIQAIRARLPEGIRCIIRQFDDCSGYDVMLTDGRPNAEISLSNGTPPDLEYTLRETDGAIETILATPNISTVSGDDVVRAVAEYQIAFASDESRLSPIMADSILAANIGCTVAVANEALAFYADTEEAIEYGASARTGWLTPKGEDRLKSLHPAILATYLRLRG